MNATRAKVKADDSTPQPPQSSPSVASSYGGAGSDFNGFIWQQLNDIQKCLGSIQESQRNLSGVQERTDEKASGKLKKIDEDLAEIKQIRHTAKWLLIIGATVGGLLLTGLGLIFKEVWSVAKPAVMQKLIPPSVLPSDPAQAPVQNPK